VPSYQSTQSLTDLRATFRAAALNQRDSFEQEKIERDREHVRKHGLHGFIECAWSQIEPGVFVDNWHIAELCTHLEAVSRGDILRLVVNVPPGAMKSLATCVFWFAWEWIERPATRWIYASYSSMLSKRDAIRARNLIESDWYQARWPGVFIPRQNTRSASLFKNNAGGFRFTTSVAGSVTGHHGDIQVVDDPIKPLDVVGGSAVTRTKINACLDWWSNTMASRLADPETGRRVIIMQRLHEADLAGAMIDTGEYEVLRLPMRFESKARSVTIVGGDRRTEEGELLWPARFTPDVVDKLEREMGSRVAAAQLQQRPSPESGNIYQRAWFNKRWRELPAGVRFVQSWDMRFKDDKESGDYVVGQLWAVKGAEFFLVDQVRARAGFETSCQMMRDMTAKHPRATAKFVENKANGPAIENTLRKKIPGIVLVEPEGGKIARANAVTPLFEAGNVHLPENAPWLSDYIEEMVKFPLGLHDDQVDATTQALLRLHLRSPAAYSAAMRQLQSST
jgi:predicted phage terminase large subunit-like protein